MRSTCSLPHAAQCVAVQGAGGRLPTSHRDIVLLLRPSSGSSARALVTGTPQDAAAAVCEAALCARSDDNISAVVVPLGGYVVP